MSCYLNQCPIAAPSPSDPMKMSAHVGCSEGWMYLAACLLRHVHRLQEGRSHSGIKIAFQVAEGQPKGKQGCIPVSALWALHGNHQCFNHCSQTQPIMLVPFQTMKFQQTVLLRLRVEVGDSPRRLSNWVGAALQRAASASSRHSLPSQIRPGSSWIKTIISLKIYISIFPVCSTLQKIHGCMQRAWQ